MCFKSPKTGNGLGDLIHYVNLYLGKASMFDSDEVEPGIKVICQVLNIFPESEFIFISITTLMIMLPILWGINKYSSNKLYSLVLIFILQGVWLVVYLAMRQAFAQSMLLSALFVFLNKEQIKHWKLYFISLIIISTFFHSTPYIIIPIAIAIYYIPDKKRIMYTALVLSLLLSSYTSIAIANTFVSYLGGFEQIGRITHYIKDDVFGGTTNQFNLLNFAPLTLLAILLLQYNDFKKQNTYFIKSLVTGVVLYNILGQIPLVNRAVCFFFVVGLIGAVPQITNKKQFYLMSVISLYFIWRSYVHYAASPHSAFLPYYFIWE